MWSIWLRLRATRPRATRDRVLVLCATQLEFGVGFGVVRLAGFGPGTLRARPHGDPGRDPGPPADAKLAYACQPLEEVAFWDPGLLGLDAHTGRRIVPMCFQAEFFGQLTGTPMSADVPSPLFQWAPQRALYPDSDARPSAEAWPRS